METLVTLDTLTVPAAYVSDETWNGFAVPYFSRTVADTIAAHFAAIPAHEGEEVPVWNEGASAFQHCDSVTCTTYTYPTMVDPVTGETLHGIGADGWMWELATIEGN